MNNSEIERRIALQKLFAERMGTVTIDESEPYVSRLVRSVPEPEKKVARVKMNKKQIKQAIKKLSKECFKPIVEIDENNLEYCGSKYFGKAWLSKEEKWPTNEKGDYLTFVLQLDIATLPEPYKKQLGKIGLVQLFFDIEYEGETLTQIVYPDNNGSYHEQPLNNSDSTDYYIEGEKPKQKIIKSWESYQDFPHNEEQLSDNVQELYEELMKSEDQLDLSAIDGDKLGGYALWTQAGYSSEDLVFQFGAGALVDNKQTFESHAPNLFAGDGTAHIFYDKEDKSFEFNWACG